MPVTSPRPAPAPTSASWSAPRAPRRALMVDFPSDINPQLWIVWGERRERLYLFGNCHTFPGRMAAWHPDGFDLCVSKFEIHEASEQSWAWIDGFLAGNEPAPPDDQDEVQFALWSGSARDFRDRGQWP